MIEVTTKIKQVICMRHDLKMRRGKQIAQGAHAAMSFICRRLQERGSIALSDFSAVERTWLTGAFAKVCCRVDSEDELLSLYDEAVVAGLEVHLRTRPQISYPIFFSLTLPSPRYSCCAGRGEGTGNR